MNARNEERALLLGREKIGKLLMKFALPAVVAQISSSLYNVVDRIFIGQGVGAMAISGLALTFPFMNLAAAFGALVGVGASTMISIKLGEKDYKTARLVLGNVIILNILFGRIYCFVFSVFGQPALRLGRQPRDCSLRQRLHDNHLVGKRIHPFISRIELCAAFVGLS